MSSALFLVASLAAAQAIIDPTLQTTTPLRDPLTTFYVVQSRVSPPQMTLRDLENQLLSKDGKKTAKILNNYGTTWYVVRDSGTLVEFLCLNGKWRTLDAKGGEDWWYKTREDAIKIATLAGYHLAFGSKK